MFAIPLFCSVITKRESYLLCVCLDRIGALLDCNRCTHYKLDVLGKLIKLGKNSLKCGNVISANLKSGIYVNIGDIAVRCKNTCDKSAKSLCIGNKIIVRVNKSCLVCNFVGELIALLNADNRAVRGLSRIVGKLDEGLGFSGALTTYKNLYQCFSSLN